MAVPGDPAQRFRLAGQTAVVTGAASGLGARFAHVLSAAGATVVAGARRKERLDRVVAELEAQGARALAVRCDVTVDLDVKNLIGAALEATDRLDVLINAAGIAPAKRASGSFGGEGARRSRCCPVRLFPGLSPELCSGRPPLAAGFRILGRIHSVRRYYTIKAKADTPLGYATVRSMSGRPPNDFHDSKAAFAYGPAARRYDARMRPFSHLQAAAVELLQLQPADVVFDVACGTGLNFSSLMERIGEEGFIVGIDRSAEMLSLAAERTQAAGWTNVELVEGSVESAHIRRLGDAALFSFTHDVLQSPGAVANVVRHLRPGGRISSVGAKLAPSWAVPVNLAVKRIARSFVTNFDNLDRPWHELERQVGAMNHRSYALGGAYVAWKELGPGHTPHRGRPRSGHPASA